MMDVWFANSSQTKNGCSTMTQDPVRYFSVVKKEDLQSSAICAPYPTRVDIAQQPEIPYDVPLGISQSVIQKCKVITLTYNAQRVLNEEDANLKSLNWSYMYLMDFDDHCPKLMQKLEAQDPPKQQIFCESCMQEHEIINCKHPRKDPQTQTLRRNLRKHLLTLLKKLDANHMENDLIQELFRRLNFRFKGSAGVFTKLSEIPDIFK